MSNKKYIGIWIATVVLALPLAAAGSAKLMGVPEMHQSFQAMGAPDWFGYFIGLCELVGAIGLLVPRFSAPAAAGLLVIMLGAIGFHVIYTPLSMGVPALVFAVLAMVIVRARKSQSIWFGASA